VLIGGSTARGQADRFSDVELEIFWNVSPTDADRREALEHSGGSIIRNAPYDASESVWHDALAIGQGADGVPNTVLHVEIANRVVDVVDSALDDLLVRHNPSDFKESLAYSVLTGIPVHGTAVIERWRSLAKVYPDGLAVAVIRRHAEIESLSDLPALIERGYNLLLINEMFCRAERQLFRILLALNRTYYSGFKWLDSVANAMHVAPPRLVDRMRRVFTAGALEGGRELTALVDETFDLVATLMPEIETERLRIAFHEWRPAWEPPIRS